MCVFPLVSIMIATYNSAQLLPRTLDAIKAQTYPKNRIEVLIIDGGSKDDTLKIAYDYGCIVLNNSKTEPVNAKLIGLKYSTGKYLVTIDHDEVLENPKSIEWKVRALMQNPECKVALCSGYKRPLEYPRLNQYISEFGDPFSLFMYNFPKGDGFLEKELKKDYAIVKETKHYIKVSFENLKKHPIFELCCLGTMIDREYFIKIPRVCEDGNIMVHLFYIMLQQGKKRLIMIKHDALVHYSVDSLVGYLPKIQWRIRNNIHFEDMGQSGFNGRTEYQKQMVYKKYLFVPYTVSCVLPLIHGMYLSITRKNSVYLIHPILCWYVLAQIIIEYGKKAIRLKPDFMSYDGKKKLSK